MAQLMSPKHDCRWILPINSILVIALSSYELNLSMTVVEFFQLTLFLSLFYLHMNLILTALGFIVDHILHALKFSSLSSFLSCHIHSFNSVILMHIFIFMAYLFNPSDMDMPFGYPRISIPGPAHYGSGLAQGLEDWLGDKDGRILIRILLGFL
jgi:hypothetical protein